MPTDYGFTGQHEDATKAGRQWHQGMLGATGWGMVSGPGGGGRYFGRYGGRYLGRATWAELYALAGLCGLVM